jgi:hypothetical protein
MRIDWRRAAIGLMAVALFGVPSTFAQTAGTPMQPKEPQAAPSEAPASHATTKAVSGQKPKPPTGLVGNQQAAPSQQPASQATTSVRGPQGAKAPSD